MLDDAASSVTQWMVSYGKRKRVSVESQSIEAMRADKS